LTLNRTGGPQGQVHKEKTIWLMRQLLGLVLDPLKR